MDTTDTHTLHPHQPWHITASDLSALGKAPREMTPSCSLVYSSPGTLSYNSPGALGYGVKRAALVIPQSVMLLVAPDCCGRNSTILSENEGYASRMFYLRMTESDLITGDHLKRIGQAIVQICQPSRWLSAAVGGVSTTSVGCPKPQPTCTPVPRVVVVCVTCVDALLGTDVERVCRQAEEAVNRSLGGDAPIRVVPSYMYALTREGTRPPMTAIRDTIYSLLERLPVKRDSVNLLGFFAPISPRSELFDVLHSMGISTIRQVGECTTLDEYMLMGEANFNIVLNGEAVYAAERLNKRLGMPYVELARLYDTERIAKQYRLFAAAVGVAADDALITECKAKADDAVARLTHLSLTTNHSSLSFALGLMISASPFELAVSLVRYGFAVPYIIAAPADTDWPYVKRLAAVSPDTKIYPPTHPSMALFDGTAAAVDIAVGKDAAGLFPEAVAVEWLSEEEPFGFQAVTELFDKCTAALEGAVPRHCERAAYGRLREAISASEDAALEAAQ